jgi:hypothetical protein
LNDLPITPEQLGLLQHLLGTWKGVKGKNHEQTLYRLRYQTKAFENGEELFHEEVRYRPWDSIAQQIYRCFIVPRGVSVIAGGYAKSGFSSFKLEAELGSRTF